MAAVRSFDRIHRQGSNSIGKSALSRLQGLLHERDAAGLGRIATKRQPRDRGESCPVLPETRFLRSEINMDEGRLTSAFERAERAILRIERAISTPRRSPQGRDEQLRAKVREAVAELDQIIREAEAA